MYISPCVQLCTVDKETNKCKGCDRTLEQIRDWSRYSDEQRMDIMKELGYGKRKNLRKSRQR
jgi:predicted Fe-S protein YdhL (DUF1289 family)